MEECTKPFCSFATIILKSVKKVTATIQKRINILQNTSAQLSKVVGQQTICIQIYADFSSNNLFL